MAYSITNLCIYKEETLTANFGGKIKFLKIGNIGIVFFGEVVCKKNQDIINTFPEWFKPSISSCTFCGAGDNNKAIEIAIYSTKKIYTFSDEIGVSATVTIPLK